MKKSITWYLLVTALITLPLWATAAGISRSQHCNDVFRYVFELGILPPLTRAVVATGSIAFLHVLLGCSALIAFVVSVSTDRYNRILNHTLPILLIGNIAVLLLILIGLLMPLISMGAKLHAEGKL